jgi:hypothetical protein
MRKTKLFYLFATAVAIFTLGLLVNCTKSDSSGKSITASNKNTLAASATQSSLAATPPFVHPGILNTRNTLDYIAQQVNSNDANRLAAYQYVLNFCNTWVSRNAYTANVAVAAGVVNQAEVDFKGDALLSYALALRWAKTGDAQYSTRCKQILDGWAGTFRTMSVESGQANQVDLEASWAAPTFAAAAEIIKYYVPSNGQGGGWTTAENTQFVAFLNRLKNQYIVNTPSSYQNNWVVSEGYAKIAIGVFIDDRDVYQSGVDLIKTVIPQVMDTNGFMSGEVCGHNDCVHFQYSLTGLSYAANTAAIQGDLSIYSASTSRLLTGYDWQYKSYNNQLNPPACVQCGVSGKIWPGIDVANRHYNTTETNYIASHYNPDTNGLPGGDLGFLAWTNYTHLNVPTSIN